MIHHLQTFRSYAAIILFAALVGTPLYAQADDVNPEIANCEEVRDESTLTQMEFCSTHIGCNMVLKLQKACAKAKGFLSRLKANLFGRKEITNDDVFEANMPDLTPSDALISKVSTVKKIVRDNMNDPSYGKSAAKSSKGDDVYYEGGLKDGTWHGAGVYIDANGGMGRGQMNNGKTEGQAQVVTTSGGMIAGDFVKSTADGNIAFQNAGGTVFAGVLRSEKWSGVVEITKRDGDHYKELFDAEGKFLARGPVAKAGQVAIAPSLPEQSATERIAKQYDERISTARSRCATSEGNCQSGCATAGVVGIFAILATKGEAGGDTSGKIQQCSDSCDNEKKRCDQQVASLEREKSQAIAEIKHKEQQAAAAAAQQMAGGRTPQGSSGAADQVPIRQGNDCAPDQGLFQSFVEARNEWARVIGWPSPSVSALRQSFQEIRAQHMSWSINMIQEQLEVQSRPYKPTGPQGPHIAAQAKIVVQMLKCEIGQRQAAAGSQKLNSIQANAGGHQGAGFSGSCKVAYDRQETEFTSINQRKPNSQAVVPGLQVVLYMTSQRLAMLDKLCQGQPQYAEYASMKQTYDGTMRTCRQIANDSADCVPRVAW